MVDYPTSFSEASSDSSDSNSSDSSDSSGGSSSSSDSDDSNQVQEGDFNGAFDDVIDNRDKGSNSSDDDTDSTPEPTNNQEQLLDGSTGSSTDTSDPLSGGSDADLPDAPSVDRDNPFDDSDSSDSGSSSSDDDSDSSDSSTPAGFQEPPESVQTESEGRDPDDIEPADREEPDPEQGVEEGGEFQEQAREQELEATEQLAEETGRSFTREDVRIQQSEQDGKTVLQAELTETGQTKVDRENFQRSFDAKRDAIVELDERTEADLTAGDDFVVRGDRVELTDQGLVKEAAAQTPGASQEDLEVQNDTVVRSGPRRTDVSPDLGRATTQDPRNQIVRELERETGAELSREQVSFTETEGGGVRGELTNEGERAVQRANAQFQNTPLSGLFSAGADAQARIEQATDPAAERFDEITPDNFVRDELERVTAPVANRFNEMTPTRGEAFNAAGDAARSAAQTDVPFTDTQISNAESFAPDSPEGTNPFIFSGSVAFRQSISDESEQEARETVAQRAEQAEDTTVDSFSPAVGRSPASGINAARGVAGIATLAGGIGVAQEIGVPEETDQSELDTPENEQRSEITVPEEKTRLSPEELGVPRESVQSGEIDIDGPEGTRVTDEGDIVIPAGTTQVARGTREEGEEREDVVEEEAEEDAEEEEEDQVQVNVPEELLPDEEQTIGEEGTQAEEDDLTTEEQAQEEQEEEVNPIQFPEQRQGEQDADPEDTRSDESFGEQVVEQGQAATSASTGQGTTVGSGIFGTVEGSAGAEATVPPILRDDQGQADAAQTAEAQGQAEAQAPGQQQAQGPAQADIVAEITGQFKTQTPAQAQTPQFGTPEGFGEPTTPSFGTPTENPPEQQNPPTQGPTPTDPPNRPPNRLPDLGIGGDDDEEDLFGLGGSNAPILTDFQNPLTGERLETDESPSNEDSFPGLDF